MTKVSLRLIIALQSSNGPTISEHTYSGQPVLCANWVAIKGPGKGIMQENQVLCSGPTGPTLRGDTPSGSKPRVPRLAAMCMSTMPIRQAPWLYRGMTTIPPSYAVAILRAAFSSLYSLSLHSGKSAARTASRQTSIPP